MNMKKLFGIIMLAMLVVFSTALVSCGDDDDEFSSKSIIGTWKWTDGTDSGTIYEEAEYTFKKNNIVTAKDSLYVYGQKTVSYTSGKYYVNGTNVLLELDDWGTEDWEIVYFDGKMMKVRWNGSQSLDTLYKL